MIAFTSSHTDVFKTITRKNPLFTNILRRDKRRLQKITFEKITNLFGVFLVSFLAFDGFDIFWMNKSNIHFNFSLKDIKDGNSILASRLHTDIKTVILNKLVFKLKEIRVKKNLFEYIQ